MEPAPGNTSGAAVGSRTRYYRRKDAVGGGNSRSGQNSHGVKSDIDNSDADVTYFHFDPDVPARTSSQHSNLSDSSLRADAPAFVPSVNAANGQPVEAALTQLRLKRYKFTRTAEGLPHHAEDHEMQPWPSTKKREANDMKQRPERHDAKLPRSESPSLSSRPDHNRTRSQSPSLPRSDSFADVVAITNQSQQAVRRPLPCDPSSESSDATYEEGEKELDLEQSACASPNPAPPSSGLRRGKGRGASHADNIVPAPCAQAPVQESVSSPELGSDNWDMTYEEGEEESVLENDPILDPDEQESFKTNARHRIFTAIQRLRDIPGEKWDETIKDIARLPDAVIASKLEGKPVKVYLTDILADVLAQHQTETIEQAKTIPARRQQRPCDLDPGDYRDEFYEEGGEPINRLLIYCLPDIDTDRVESIFRQYGNVVKCAKLNRGRALVFMTEVGDAQWIVENLHTNIPVGLDKPIGCVYATSENVQRSRHRFGIAQNVTDKLKQKGSKNPTPTEADRAKEATTASIRHSGEPAKASAASNSASSDVIKQIQENRKQALARKKNDVR